jgi:rare lipoprotein A
VIVSRVFLRSLAPIVFLICAGCGAKRPIADRQPAPTQPAPASEESIDKAKRDTNVSPPSSSPAKSSRHPKTPPAPAPAGYSEEGNASWYGDPFHGRHAANGEIYDMYKLTAAHRTLPFETMVRVTNLNNGKSTVVRITDRGPFVGNRILDLSLAGAREIDSVGPGVVPIRLEVLGNVDPKLGFFTVQVGAFRDRANAEHLRDRLSPTYSPIFIQQFAAADSGTFYRVRVGKISGEDAARDYADTLSSKEGFTTMIFRLDDVTP